MSLREADLVVVRRGWCAGMVGYVAESDGATATVLMHGLDPFAIPVEHLERVPIERAKRLPLASDLDYENWHRVTQNASPGGPGGGRSGHKCATHRSGMPPAVAPGKE